MKCVDCGSLNPARSPACLNCGAPLVVQRTGVQNESVPEWRKEVTRKAREYGERKKSLTTPPDPLKSNPNTETRQPLEQAKPAKKIETPEKSAVAPPVVPFTLNRIEPAEPDQIERPVERSRGSERPVERTTANIRLDPEWIETEPPPPVRAGFPPKQPQFERIEIDNSFELMEEEREEGQEGPDLMLSARAASFAIDQLVVAVVIYAAIFISNQFFQFDLWGRIQSAWLPSGGILLLLHCIYHVYFYKTSRQTPGQVFFALEVRNPGAGTISFGQAIGRWAALVFLNVFNIVPLFSGRDFLLLDHLSGTEVRSLKNR